jgi:hypothetical protein
MMHNDSAAILDDLLSRWHFHCKNFSPVPVRGADPMFKHALRAKGEQTLDAIAEDQELKFQMEALDYHVYEMEETDERPMRSAILVNARNCYTGRSVWLSPRLPVDPIKRGFIVVEARSILTRRLMDAGVM